MQPKSLSNLTNQKRRTILFVVLFFVCLFILIGRINSDLVKSVQASRSEMIEIIDSIYDSQNRYQFKSNDIIGFIPEDVEELDYRTLREQIRIGDDYTTYLHEEDYYYTDIDGTSSSRKIHRKNSSYNNNDYNDSLDFVNRYSNYKYYYIFPHKRNSWRIIALRRRDKSSFECDTIIPKLIGFNQNVSIGSLEYCIITTHIVNELSDRFNVLEGNEDIIKDLLQLKTEYHHINPNDYRHDYSDEDTICSNGYLMNYREKTSRIFTIEKDLNKINAMNFLCYLIAFIVSFLISLIFSRLYYRIKQSKNLENENNCFSSDETYDKLLQTLNPENFNDESVSVKKKKLTGKLYSILKKSNADETIVFLIYEKAKKIIEKSK